jgi:hypothetical protein
MVIGVAHLSPALVPPWHSDPRPAYLILAGVLRFGLIRGPQRHL